MFSWTTLPTCHGHLSKKNNVASVERQSSPLWLYCLSNGTACDTVLHASLRSPPELWHVAANSMHHATCSFTWGSRTDSWAFHNLSTHKSYQTYILKTPRPPGSPTLKQHIQTIWYTYHQRMNENTGYMQWFWLQVFRIWGINLGFRVLGFRVLVFVCCFGK